MPGNGRADAQVWWVDVYKRQEIYHGSQRVFHVGIPCCKQLFLCRNVENGRAWRVDRNVCGLGVPLTPVSYTHLDVYKRQTFTYLIQSFSEFVPWNSFHPDIWSILHLQNRAPPIESRPQTLPPQLTWPRPVSYTHLDVYKRQVWICSTQCHI